VQADTAVQADTREFSLSVPLTGRAAMSGPAHFRGRTAGS
jgi:hypothetical protein